MRNNKNCYMSRVLVLKCEHVVEMMEISDLTASSSASVEGVFVGAVSQPFFSLFRTFNSVQYNMPRGRANPSVLQT